METIDNYLAPTEKAVVQSRRASKHLGQDEVTYYDVINIDTGTKVAEIREEECTSTKRPFKTTRTFVRKPILQPI